MTYSQEGQLQLANEPDLEIKVIPAGKLYVIQIGCPFLRGTLILDEQHDKDDVLEIASLICNAVEELTIRVDEGAPTL